MLIHLYICIYIHIDPSPLNRTNNANTGHEPGQYENKFKHRREGRKKERVDATQVEVWEVEGEEWTIES